MMSASAVNFAKPTKTISIASGKGGVGKTTVVTNLAFSLAKLGKSVLVFDGDVGMANADIMFGVRAHGNILDVIQGRLSIQDVMIEVAPNITLIPGGSGSVEFNKMSLHEKRALLDCIQQIERRYDYLLIDTAPGIADHVLYLNSAVENPVIVVTPDPASVADSYALIKVLNQNHRVQKFSIICNQVRDADDGVQLYRKFNDVVDRFLYVSLDYLGSIPQDMQLKKATLQQRLIVRQVSNAESSRAIESMALRLDCQPLKAEMRGGMQMFWEQLLGMA